MRLSYYTLLVSIIILTACQEKSTENQSINGIWESVGSGWMLQIQDSTSYAFFDVTSNYCLPARRAPLDELLSSLQLDSDTLSLKKGVITYKFIRINQLPIACTSVDTSAQRNDPAYNFAVFVETVKEHYAFMQLNGINWEQLYQEQKGKIDKNTSDADLYLLIEETLEKLNDNHAFLEANDKVYEALEKLDSDEEEEENQEEGLPEIGDFQIAEMVANNHLQEDLTQDSWLIKWGKLNDSIGYLQVKAMWLYADLDIPEALIVEVGYVDAYVHTFHQMYEGDYTRKEVAAAGKIMDKVMNDLADMEAIVIDVRFNGGGQDAVSFEILSSFIHGEQQIATQKLRYGDKFSPTQTLSITGKPDAYTQAVYVLTSPQTGSAAETLSIASLSADHIKRIGAATSGAISTALEKKLPNGWGFSISNEIYMDNDGNAYENIGIPVDYELGYPEDRQTFFRSVANDLEADKQDILRAIAALRQE